MYPPRDDPHPDPSGIAAAFTSKQAANTPITRPHPDASLCRTAISVSVDAVVRVVWTRSHRKRT